MKDIVIIANFCRDFSENDNGRFMYLCKELSKEHRVEIITSDFSHIKKAYRDPLTMKWPFTITFLHEPGYKKNISFQRFLSHRAWGKEVQKYLKKRSRPDVIYCAVPSLTGPLAAAKYCEKNHVKFIIDVQDLWPEAFKMVFHVPVISNLIFAPFNYLANSIYKRADEICAVSETYVQRALQVNKKCTKGHAVFLGTNLDTFDTNVKNNPIDKHSNELWRGYCGTLGASYDLTCVFDALEIVRNKGIKPPKFIVMGDGPRTEEFQSYAHKKELEVVFTGRLPYDQMCGMLAACDMTVNPITGNSVASIINKHGDYASSGVPVLNTQNSIEYRKLVETYDMGFDSESGDAYSLAQNLIILINNREIRNAKGFGARRCAEEKFNRARTYMELVGLIKEC